MSLSVVLLVIGSALAHATWNAILKRSKDPENAIFAMMAVASAVGLIVAFALRMTMPTPKVLAWILASGLLEAAYFVALARALSRAPLGSVYTVVRGGALLLVWPVSVVFLKETITMERGFGTALVMLGLASTSLAERKKTQAAVSAVEEADAKKVRSGLVVAAVCALFVAGYHLAYKLALSNGGRPEAVNSLSLTFAVIVNLILLKPSRRPLAVRAFRDEPVRTVIGGVLGSVGFLIFLFAMKDAGAGIVLTLRNTSILFAQVLGFALGERPKRLGIIGAVLVTVGAVFLSRG
jgi:uncharacterized membrane protein